MEVNGYGSKRVGTLTGLDVRSIDCKSPVSFSDTVGQKDPVICGANPTMSMVRMRRGIEGRKGRGG